MAQDLTTKTVTAPRAVIKINGIASGYMRNVTVTENVQRANVQGISNLALQEVPPTSISCTLNCDFFFISLKRPEVRAFFPRDFGLDAIINTLILGEVPIQVHMYKKAIVKQENGVVTQVDNEGETLGIVRDFYPNSESFNIAEGQVSGINVSGIYLTPMFFKE
jgi:hypothetical protein